LEELGQHIGDIIEREDILLDLVYFLSQTRTMSTNNQSPMLNFATFVATGLVGKARLRGEPNILGMFARKAKSLSLRSRTILLSALLTYNKDDFEQLAAHGWDSEELEANCHLIRYSKCEPGLWHKILTQRETVFVVTRLRGHGQSESKSQIGNIGDVFVAKNEKSDGQEINIDKKGIVSSLPYICLEDAVKLTRIREADIQEIGEGLRREQEALEDRPKTFEFYIE
jgi:hypothetical protein